MNDLETSILTDSLLTDKQDPAVECSHEFDMNDENDQLSVIDAVSVQTELEQLFNEFSNYNHHIKVFKKLLNLKDLKNEYNFFAFNRANQPAATDKQCCNATHLSSSCHNSSSANQLNPLTKLFKGGELSAMQVHSQLATIKEQFIESQLLVTCLVHNLQRLRKHYCGTALDLVSSSELLASLEKDHSTLKTCKSIFKYQCSEKRKQLTKLKQQLRQAHEDWNQLIVKRPTITKLSDEELLLLNKSKDREKKKRKSVQLTGNSDNNQFSGQLRQSSTDAAVTGEASPVNSQVNRVADTESKPNNDLNNDLNNDSNSKADNQSMDGNSSSSSDPDKEKDTGGSSQGTDSAVHSESEADSLQELAEAIYRRKSKLDRLERECYSFMSRLANRNRTEERPASVAEERSNEQYDNSNLILDDYNDYANDYEEDDDEDLLDDEEYEDVEFDEEPPFDAFASGEVDIESLINRYSLDVHELEDESTSRDDEQAVQDDSSATISIDGEMRLANGDERLINDEIRRSVDYLIGQSRSIVDSTGDLDDEEQMNRYLNEDATSPAIDRLVEQEVMNGVSQQDSSGQNSSPNASAEAALLDSAEQRLDASDDLEPLVPRNAPTAEESAQLAETGEPIGLCRLRRRAVKVLAARIRTEKEYYEKRENELKKKLDHLATRNEELESRLVVQPHSNALFVFSTAFVFCSLISYFMQTLN